MQKSDVNKCPDCGEVIENTDGQKEISCKCGALLVSEEIEESENLLAEEMSRKWYYSIDRQKYGPVPWNRVKEFIAGEKLRADDLIWSRGMESWTKVRMFPELIECFPEGQRPAPPEPGQTPASAGDAVRDEGAAASPGAPAAAPDEELPNTFLIQISAGLLAALAVSQIIGIAVVIYHAWFTGLISAPAATWLIAAFIAGSVLFLGTSQLLRLLCDCAGDIVEIRRRLSTTAADPHNEEK